MPPKTRKVTPQAPERPDASHVESAEPEPPDRASEHGDSDESPKCNNGKSREEDPGPSQMAESRLDSLSQSITAFIAYLKQRDEEQRVESRQHKDTLNRFMTKLASDIRIIGTAQQMNYDAIEGLLRKQALPSSRAEQGTEGTSTPDDDQPPRQGEGSKGKERASEPNSQYSRFHRLTHVPESPIPHMAKRPPIFERTLHVPGTNEEDEPPGPLP